MAFEKGKSGNPGGMRKAKIWRDAICAAIREHTGLDQVEAVKTVAMSLVKEAMDGDVTALKEIGDRIDGKSDANVSVDHSGSITHEHEPVSNTLDWLRGITGSKPVSEVKEPLPH